MTQATASQGSLLRILGLSFGLAVVIGSTVGVGILKAPGDMAAQLGSVPVAIAVWVAISLYALLGTSIMAEVATVVPKAGAWYAYADRAFGGASGFTIGWINWLMLVSTAATLAVAIGDFLGQLVPSMSALGTEVAVATLLGFALLHWAGTRSSGKVQEVTSVIKALAFLLLVAACFIYGGRPDSAFHQPVTPEAPSGVALVLALVAAVQIVIFAFDGWYGAIYFAEEDRDPGRNLPRAMVYGTLGIISIYFLVNLALWWTLPLTDMASASASGEIAAAAAARALFGATGSDVIFLVALIAVPSVLNATMLQSTRVLYSLGRDGYNWSGFGRVNKRGTPTLALLASTAVAIALIVGSKGLFDKLLAITTFYYALVYLSGFLAMWRLRQIAADVPRPYHAMFHPWSTIYVVAISLLFLAGVLYAYPEDSAWSIALIALAVPIHYAIKRR
jgi:APA family basic amino acid/polyamine antiporter